MVYQRDPLSVRFDTQAANAIARAIRAYQRHAANPGFSEWIELRIPNLTITVVREGDERLSRMERAFQRSLYHDERIHKPRKNSGGPWSLMREWGPVPLAIGQSRTLRISVSDERDGKRAAKRKPKRDQWTENPSLQSGGIGSPKRRFA